MKVKEIFREEFEELIILIPPNWKTEKLILLKEDRWLKFSNNFYYLIHKRPSIYGGYQIHIKDRYDRMWAYRQDGKRSEPNKYKLKAPREVKKLVRTVFHLPDNFLIEGYSDIESYLVKADETQISVEI